jgi:hypothetical protein
MVDYIKKKRPYLNVLVYGDIMKNEIVVLKLRFCFFVFELILSFVLLIRELTI